MIGRKKPYSLWKRLSYSARKKLHENTERYEAEKKKVAGQVVELLEQCFKGIKNQVEVIDVPTLMTWERYMGGTHGFANMPRKKVTITSSLLSKKMDNTLPGLTGFYFVGAWATSAGALFVNALSGKRRISAICKKDGKKFKGDAGA